MEGYGVTMAGRIENLTGKGSFRNKELASAAGKKGTEIQKKMRTAKQTYQYILSLKAPKKIEEKLKEHIPDLSEEMSMQLAIYLKTAIEALNGNMVAVKEITDRIDGKSIDRQAQVDSEGNDINRETIIKFVE